MDTDIKYSAQKRAPFCFLIVLLLLATVPNYSYAQSASLSIGDYIVGDSDANIIVPITYDAIGVDVVGLTFDIVYDNSVINAVNCTFPDFGACNTAFTDTVKFAILSFTMFPLFSDVAFIEFDIIGNPGDVSVINILPIDVIDTNFMPVQNVFIKSGSLSIICENDIFFSATEDFTSTSMEDIEAGNSITAVNAIYAGADIIYDAGNCVSLDGGFEVIQGGSFEAIIDGCGGSF